MRLRSATWLREEVAAIPDWVVGIDGTRSVGKTRNQATQIAVVDGSLSTGMVWLTGSLKPMIQKPLTRACVEVCACMRARMWLV